MCVDHSGYDPALVRITVDYLGHSRNAHASSFYYQTAYKKD